MDKAVDKAVDKVDLVVDKADLAADKAVMVEMAEGLRPILLNQELYTTLLSMGFVQCTSLAIRICFLTMYFLPSC